MELGPGKDEGGGVVKADGNAVPAHLGVMYEGLATLGVGRQLPSACLLEALDDGLGVRKREKQTSEAAKMAARE
jgi:hypothetical protein